MSATRGADRTWPGRVHMSNCRSRAVGAACAAASRPSCIQRFREETFPPTTRKSAPGRPRAMEMAGTRAAGRLGSEEDLVAQRHQVGKLPGGMRRGLSRAAWMRGAIAPYAGHWRHTLASGAIRGYRIRIITPDWPVAADQEPGRPIILAMTKGSALLLPPLPLGEGWGEGSWKKVGVRVREFRAVQPTPRPHPCKRGGVFFWRGRCVS